MAIITRTIAPILGINDSVISLIDVAAWTTPITKPTIKATKSMGEATITATINASLPISVIDKEFIILS
jgi:O-succinylbenzoate synthase